MGYPQGVLIVAVSAGDGNGGGVTNSAENLTPSLHLSISFSLGAVVRVAAAATIVVVVRETNIREKKSTRIREGLSFLRRSFPGPLSSPAEHLITTCPS